MKTNSIKAKHVYSENKQNTVYMKKNKEEWFPINFQWIPVLKLNNDLNIKTHKMKKIVLLPIVLLLALITSCSVEPITGSGNITSEFRNVDNFTKVSSKGVFEVSITQGTPQSVKVIADNNILHKINTKVINDKLKIFLDDEYNYKNVNLKVIIVTPNINVIKNSGSGSILVTEVETIQDFNIYNSGSGSISVEGKAENLTIKNEGSGSILTSTFPISDCKVEIDGSGNVEVNCSNHLNAKISGSGSVFYIGSPTIDSNISGSGQVINL